MAVGNLATPGTELPAGNLGAENNIAIRVSNLSKCYHLYDAPRDRLKQFVAPRLQRLAGQSPKQYFREFWALKDISFEVKKGETVGIIGRNGSGKSTLLQIICGTLTPTGGMVETNGRIAALLELGSGFNPEFTGRENVYMNAAVLGQTKEEIQARFDGIAAFADIGDFMDQPVKTYSSGMYARLAFSASIFVDPDILVVDEILAVGDAPFQAKCVQAFHRLRDNGCTILLVSHDAYMIRTFCQRALYLRKGEFMGFGESSMIVDKYSLEVENALASAQKRAEVDAPAAAAHSADFTGLGLFRISDVELFDERMQLTSVVRSGEVMTIRFRYQTLSIEAPKVTFVFSLYRHDGLYICGNTTLMDNIPPFDPGRGGKVSVTFPGIRMLAGRYIWRVAIDDERAFGIYAEANQVCEFQVVDRLEAVGLFNLDRSWLVEIETR